MLNDDYFNRILTCSQLYAWANIHEYATRTDKFMQAYIQSEKHCFLVNCRISSAKLQFPAFVHCINGMAMVRNHHYDNIKYSEVVGLSL